MDDNSEKSYSPAKTVQKAFAILELLGERQPMRAAQLAAGLGLSRSNVLRLLSTLSQMGYVEKGFDSLFRLGIKTFILGSNFSSANDFADLAYPFMKKLSEISQENVNLGIIYEQSVLYLNKIQSSHYLKLDTPIGKMDPLYCTGLGKVLLSGFSEEELDKYFATAKIVAYTRKTIIDPNELVNHLRQVRNQGFAFDLEEYDEGVHCVAAPIYNYQGRVIGAISLSAPSVRLTNKKIKALKHHLIIACEAVSKKLGYKR